MSISKQLVAHSSTYQRLTQLFDSQKLPNTMLFAGQRSVGKYKTALALAQHILCESKSACGQCGSCLRVSKEQHESLMLVSPEKGIIKVDQTRNIISFLSQKLDKDEYKIVIIDQAECFNNQSANALLKTLEEPPRNCFILLITQSLYSLLITVRSRCQVFRFGGLTKEQIKQIRPTEDWLIDFSERNLQKIEELSDESYQQIFMDLADALSSLNENTFFQTVKSIQPIVKNKEQCLVLIQALQMYIKSTLLHQLKVQTVSLEWQLPMIERLKRLDRGQLFSLFQDSVQMEYELKSNFDLLLSFECLFKKILEFFDEGESNAESMDRHTHAP